MRDTKQNLLNSTDPHFLPRSRNQCHRCGQIFRHLLRLRKGWKSLIILALFLTIFLLLHNAGNPWDGDYSTGYRYSSQHPHPQILWAYREDLVKAGEWQEIQEIGGGAEDSDATKFFLYSAYLDYYKSEDIIRIIAITPSHSSQQLFCHLFDAQLHPLGVVGGVVKSTLWAVTHYPYSPGFILCNLQALEDLHSQNESSPFLQQLRYVSISPTSVPILNPETALMLSNLVAILNAGTYQRQQSSGRGRGRGLDEEPKPEPHEFGLCVQPIFNFNKVFGFIQFLEFYRMMGVSHFTFYNISIGPDVSCVIRYYVEAKETEIQVLNWSGHLPSKDLLHNHGQVAQENDCILRYRGVAKYVVGVDLDEFILPREGISDFRELIATVDKEQGQKTPLIAQYQFRQRFFGVECSMFKLPMDPATEEAVVKEDLLLYRHVQATAELTPHDTRSKYISVPKLVVEPGVHWMREGVGSAIEVKVGESLAYIRHYRQVCTEEWKCAGSRFEIDMLGHHYAPKLLPRVAHIVEKVVGLGESNRSCNLDLRKMRESMYCSSER